MKTESVVGIHAVEAVLNERPQDIVQLFIADRQDSKIDRLLHRAQKLGLPIHSVKRSELDKRTRNARHQGIMSEVRLPKELNEQDLDDLMARLDQKGETPLLVMLDEVQDPHNLGAVLRTCDAVGAHALIVPKDNAAPLTSVARKVSSGGSETVPLIRVTNLKRTMNQLQQQGVWAYGLAGEATHSVYETSFKGATLIVMGSEGSGMRRLTRETCDDLISIPMQGKVESLNVSVACGVVLYEVLRQKQLA